MRKFTTRLISAALAASMMLAVCPVSAFAAAGAETEPTAASSSLPVKLTTENVNKNGYVIGLEHAEEYELEAGEYTHIIEINGTLSQENDKITIHLKGEITAGEGVSWFIFVNSPCTLILDDEGSITNTYGVCVHNESPYAKVIVNGGNYTAAQTAAFENNNGGTMELAGGTICNSKYGINVSGGTTTTIGGINFENNTEGVHLSYGATFELTDDYKNLHEITVGLDKSEYEYLRRARQITTHSTEKMLEYVTSAKEGYEVRYCDGTHEPDTGDTDNPGGGGESGGGGGRGDEEGGGGVWEFSLDGSGRPVVFDAENSTTDGYLYLVKHTHKWDYTAEGAVITAKCTDPGCRYANGVTLTLTKPKAAAEGSTESFEAGVVLDNFDVTGAEVGSVYYEGTGATDYARSTAAPETEGTYKASVAAGGVTASVEYAIASDRPDEPVTPDEPVAPGDDADEVGGAVAAALLTATAGWAGYELGLHLYQEHAMNIGYWPRTRMEMASLIWQCAGKPEPASTEAFEDIDANDADAQKAARWVVEQELVKLDDTEPAAFRPGKAVTRLRVCLTWHEANEKGLLR